MFDRIADRYDLLNKLMSFGLDKRWRRKLIASLELEGAGRALDVATGTADVAIAIAVSHSEAQVVGLDPSRAMLDVGRKKVDDAQLDDRVVLTVGDAQNMREFVDGTFDASCISFGIRNVPDRAAALREMARVTRPGGRVAILELAEPRSGWLAPAARFHIHTVVPRLGAWISGDDEYAYLAQSIEAFPPPETFAALMEANDLCVLTIEPMSFGAAHLYVSTPRS
jgi:demethylmenaquinone methyltransferase/2-methoxy-6-polyprenyl-1,4-benzoquinol methylase